MTITRLPVLCLVILVTGSRGLADPRLLLADIADTNQTAGICTLYNIYTVYMCVCVCVCVVTGSRVLADPRLLLADIAETNQTSGIIN